MAKRLCDWCQKEFNAEDLTEKRQTLDAPYALPHPALSEQMGLCESVPDGTLAIASALEDSLSPQADASQIRVLFLCKQCCALAA